MESSHHASNLDPSSVLGFGSALALLDTAEEVGRLLTGALRSMGLADLQAVILNEGLVDGGRVVGSVGTGALPDPVVDELWRIGNEVSLGASARGSSLSRREIDVDAESFPALAGQGVRRLTVLRLGTVDYDYGLVVAGRADPSAHAPIEKSSLQMMAAQVSMALHRIELNREREAKADALRASEARYRELYENAPVAYMSVDQEGSIRMANQRAADLLAISKDRICGKNITDFCVDTAEEAEAVRRLNECIRGNERLYDHEMEVCRANGEQLWVNMSIQPLRSADDQAECLVMMVDITDRVYVEMALRETRAELEERVQERTAELERANEQLQEQADRLSTLRDIDQAILAAGSPHEIAMVAAERMQDILPCVRVSVSVVDLEEGAAQVLAAWQKDEVLSSGTRIPLDELYLSDTLRAGHTEVLSDLDDVSLGAAGQKIRALGVRSVLLLPMMIEGQLTAILKVGRAQPDAFTEKDQQVGRELADHLAIALRQSRLLETVREKREQLATLRDIDQAILAAESPKEIAAEAIQRARKIIPYRSATVTVIDWNAERARVLAAVDNVLDGPTSLPLDEVYLSDDLRAGRTEVISDRAYEPVPEAEARIREMGLRSILCLPMVVEGEVIGVIHVGRTEPDAFTETDWQMGRELADHMAIAIRQSRLLEEVQAQRERLEERVQERTAELESFTYSVSHDLRTPLRAIDGYTRILREEHADQLDDEGQRLLDVVYDSAQTMGDQIDDLLTLSRVGRRELNRVPVDMEALAREAFDELRRAHARADDVTFRLHPLPRAEGDRSMLRHVFVNLLSNALKFTRREETPCIEVRSRERDDGTVLYFVRDNGVGFDDEHADDMFGVFQRLHDDSTFEGTGVGLALVERVLRRHDGEVWAEGTEGEGATIFFTLPRPDDE